MTTQPATTPLTTTTRDRYFTLIELDPACPPLLEFFVPAEAVTIPIDDRATSRHQVKLQLTCDELLIMAAKALGIPTANADRFADDMISYAKEFR